jgi:lipopolysaccharide/colanic/teichoic acid biosynthesis glycosyltransferase
MPKLDRFSFVESPSGVAALENLRGELRAHPVGVASVPLLVRLVEIIVALVMLIIFAPVMLIEAIIIRRGSPGPALFFQTRVGASGVPFRFVKFRTLYHDARERFPELYVYRYEPHELDTFKFKIEDDPRVSVEGKWLRKTSLDELPNFWNVLKGDMALVGPRPEIPEMLPYYSGKTLLKFTVRPGITGLAQISGRGRLSFKDTVALDVDYVYRRSLLLDLQIIAKTIYLCLTRDGAF